MLPDLSNHMHALFGVCATIEQDSGARSPLQIDIGDVLEDLF
jgi:hypothetical protein